MAGYIGRRGSAVFADVATNTVETQDIQNGAVTDAKIAALSASKLTGALPALDGSALTGIDSLPSQSGQSGYYLTTDGTTASWADTGAKEGIFWENGTTISSNYTIPTNTNAGSFGPITIASGVTVTISAGSTWTVV